MCGVPLSLWAIISILLAFQRPQWLLRNQIEVWLGVGKQLNRVAPAAGCWGLFRTSLGVFHPVQNSSELW